MQQPKLPGLFGPITTRTKAGDLAPDIAFTRVLHAPLPTAWTSANLSGRITVLTFFPDTSHNLQSVSMWNAVVAQFADRPIQFLWITAEKESSLLPFLKEHPLHGWVFHDPGGRTGNAYGLENPAAVLIGTDRRIIGFDRRMLPTDRVVNAVIENRIRTTPIKPDSPDLKAFLESNQVLLNAESPRMPRIENNKPAFPPSYEVHISPTTMESNSTSSTSAPDYWSARGFDLKSLIARLYNIDASRIDFPDAEAAKNRYDVALVLPEEESEEAIKHRIQEALKKHLHLSIAPETQSMDVYVVTAPNGPGPALHKAEPSGGGAIGSSSTVFEWKSPDGRPPTPEDIQRIMENMKSSSGVTVGQISVDGGTIVDFCRTLEGGLDRPVIDETNLTGRYDFQVARADSTREQFFQQLHDQLGLIITPSQRNVTLLAVRPI